MKTENLPARGEEKEQLQLVPKMSIFLDMKRFEDAQRVATLLASSNLVPVHFQKSVANCVIALNLADRLMVDPFMLMQNMYVVHGRPGIEGKLAIALIEGSGRFSPLKFEFAGEGKTEKGIARAGSCTAYATELASGEIIKGPPVTWEMAVAEGWTKPKGTETSKWQTLPDLMYRYRSAMFFARVNCPGALLGLRTIDELEEIGAISMKEIAPGQYEAEQSQEGKQSLDEIKQVFSDSVPKNTLHEQLDIFLSEVAAKNKVDIDAVIADAAKDKKNLANFWKFYSAWTKQQVMKEKKQEEKKEKQEEKKSTMFDPTPLYCPQPCPNREGTYMLKSYCGSICESREGCPVWG